MLNHNHLVLLIMDAQNKVLEWVPNPGTILTNINKAINAARSANIPVIYVKVSFREGYHEIHTNNEAFSNMKQSGKLFLENHESADIHTAVQPLDSDVIVVKKRVSAFSGSDLEIILRSLKAENLVITGFFTSGVVLSTVREACDKDFKLTVIADCCGDADDETHDFLVKKIFPAQAMVMNTKEWIASLFN